MISLLTSEDLQSQSAKFKLLPQNMSWPGAAFAIIYTAHTLTVPVVCHFGHFVKKKWTRKLFILRSSYVQQSMLTKLKLVVWRKTLIRRLSEKHLGSCFQDMSKVNFILWHLGKTLYLILGFLISAVVRRADWNGVVKDAQL